METGRIDFPWQPIVVNPVIQRLTEKDLADIRQVVREEIERAKVEDADAV